MSFMTDSWTVDVVEKGKKVGISRAGADEAAQLIGMTASPPAASLPNRMKFSGRPRRVALYRLSPPRLLGGVCRKVSFAVAACEQAATRRQTDRLI